MLIMFFYVFHRKIAIRNIIMILATFMNDLLLYELSFDNYSWLFTFSRPQFIYKMNRKTKRQ